MEAPKEIYVHEVSAQELSEPKLNEYHIKYIRADLAEPTVDDIAIIINIFLKQWIPNKPEADLAFHEEILEKYKKLKGIQPLSENE